MNAQNLLLENKLRGNALLEEDYLLLSQLRSSPTLSLDGSYLCASCLVIIVGRAL